MGIYSAGLTLSEIKDFVGVSGTDADTWLQREAEGLFQAIEAYLDRPIVIRHIQEDLDGMGGASLILNYAPVQSILSVNIDPSRKFQPSTQLAPDAYFIETDDRISLEHDFFPYGDQNVRFSYMAGYAEIEVPFERQRFDIKEANNGALLTAYLPTGRYTPKALSETLQVALNSVGDEPRTVTFDAVQRRFTIAQPSGYCEVVTAESGVFTASDSATGLLGWTADQELTDGEIKSGVVSVGIPEVFKSVVLENIAEQYQRGRFGTNRYSIFRSYRLGQFQAVYNTEDSGGGEGKSSPFSEKHTHLLEPFRRWTLF